MSFNPKTNASEQLFLMVIWVFAWVFFFMLMSDKTARCSPLDCESLPSADGRNYCRAMSKGDKSYCEFIHDQQLRAQCRAMVRPPGP